MRTLPDVMALVHTLERSIVRSELPALALIKLSALKRSANGCAATAEPTQPSRSYIG